MTVNDEVCEDAVQQAQECVNVPEDQCNIVEEEYCRDVTRPVCMTRTELDCGDGINAGSTPPVIPNTNFDVTEPNIGINPRNQPLTAAQRKLL